MERGIITMNEYGEITISNGEIWMSEMELTDLFGVIVPTVRATIRAVYTKWGSERSDASIYPMTTVWMYSVYQ